MSRSPEAEISTDPGRLDRDLVHRFLSRESYWALGIARETVDRAIDGSLCFGAYEDGSQIGFARAVTDGSTFAWIADVFVVSSHRGRGLGRQLVETVLAHPDVRQVRNVLLATADAHGLYARFGFAPLGEPERWLNLRRVSGERFGPAADNELPEAPAPDLP